MVRPASRKKVVVELQTVHGLSQRRSCSLAGISRSATLGSAQILGALDADGKATLSLTVPTGAGLAGKRLYATGVIGDASADDGIRCLTSTCSIEILP